VEPRPVGRRAGAEAAQEGAPQGFRRAEAGAARGGGDAGPLFQEPPRRFHADQLHRLGRGVAGAGAVPRLIA